MTPDGAMPLVRLAGRVFVEAPGGAVELRSIIGVGRNYAAHAREQGADVPDRPMFFTKNINAIALDAEPIVIPDVCAQATPPGAPPEQVDFEGELAVILGRDARDIDERRALDPDGPVLGVCCANDVSARWWQKRGSGGQFWRGKSFDTFCPLGPGVVPISPGLDPDALAISTVVSGEVMQEATTARMIFPVARLLAEASRATTLEAGTVLLTGTPEGVGMSRTPPRYLRPGDEVVVRIEGVGELRNPVALGVV